MNEIFNKFLLPGDKFMSEMHLRQPGFTYSACGPFRVKRFKETGYSKHIYQNKLDKACFQNEMGYGDFKDLTRRRDSDKIKIPNMMDVKEVLLLQWSIDFLIKKLLEAVIKMRICQTSN